jgi:hypothetical protein
VKGDLFEESLDSVREGGAILRDDKAASAAAVVDGRRAGRRHSLASDAHKRDNYCNHLVQLMRESNMSRATLEDRVAALERQISGLLDIQSHSGHTKDWRRTRGAFTGDSLMKQVFEEGRKIREAERKRIKPRRKKERPVRS